MQGISHKSRSAMLSQPLMRCCLTLCTTGASELVPDVLLPHFHIHTQEPSPVPTPTHLL
jgi:hypothetical protein